MKSLFVFLLLFCYGEIHAVSHLIPYRKGNKWGYADSTGTIVVKPIYESVSHNGSSTCHIVEVKGKYGLLNSVGKKWLTFI